MFFKTWTRRGLMAAAASTALVAGAVTSPAIAQTPPNVLIVGQIAEPKSLDPAAVTAVNDFRILVNVYEGLTRYKSGTLEVEPALATGMGHQRRWYGVHVYSARRYYVPRRDTVQRRGCEIQFRPDAG